MLITDQVATAPCTDLFQARSPTFEAKPIRTIDPKRQASALVVSAT
jgi:hypothetical protein